MSDQIELLHDPRADAVDRLHAATAIYTASPVVKELLLRVGWPDRAGRLMDPSAGDGSFLIGALELLDFEPGDFATVERVLGWEIHPGAVADARDRIREHLRARGWAEADADRAALRIVKEKDFLADSFDECGFSIIVGNPPYLRLLHLPEYFRRAYEEIIPVYARADILNAFLDRCCAILPEGGVVGMVTSDRWITNLGAADLRAALGRRVVVSHISRLDVTTCFYRPKNRRKGTPPRVHPIQIVLEAGRAEGMRLTSEAIALGDSGLVTQSAGPTLGDYATIRIGPYMGPSGTFVVDEGTALKFMADGLCDGVTLVPVVGPEEIPFDRDEVSNRRRFAIVTKREIEPRGVIAAHLRAAHARMPKKCLERGVYWLPYEAMNIPLSGSRILIPRVAKRIRVIDLPDGVAPIDHNIQVASPVAGVSLETIKEILQSPEADEWIRAFARRIDGGYLDITVTVLRRMPVPARFQQALAPTGS